MHRATFSAARAHAARRLGQASSVAKGMRELNRRRSSTPPTIWIGDSHSRFNLGRSTVDGRLVRLSESDYVWSLGPRLMYSVAKHGWPADIRVGSLPIRAMSRGSHINVCFVLGEIDVRVFLGAQIAAGSVDLSFAPRYVSRCLGLARTMGATPVIGLIPIEGVGVGV